MQIYPPRPRRRLPVVQPTPTVDRIAFGVAVFSAFTFAAMLTLICAVVALAALFLRTEIRWTELTAMLGTASLPVSPLAVPTELPAFASNLPAEAPTATVAVPPTAEPTPTLLEQPTTTPVGVSPLDTIVPSEVATPTATLPTSAQPSQPLTPDELNYQAALLQQANVVLSALSMLNGLIANPQLADPTWEEQVTTQINLLRASYNQMLGMQPPLVFSLSYNALVVATSQCLSAFYTLEQAVQADDSTYLNQGLAELNSCNPEVVNATSQISSVSSP